MEIEEAVPKLTRSASDMLKKNLTGLVLVEILTNFISSAHLTTMTRTRGRRRRGRMRFPVTIVNTNHPSWLKASAGAFSVTT